MICYVVRTTLACHTAEACLTAIPKVVVRHCTILRVAFDIKSTVTFLLIGSTSRFAIEEVEVVNPQVTVVCVHRNSVVHAPHDGKVAELYRASVADKESETVNSSVETNTLNCDVHFRIAALSFNLYALSRTAEAIHVGGLDSSDYTECDRSLVISLLIKVYDVLESHTSCLAAIAACYDIGGDSLGVVGCNIDNLSAVFQSTIVLVGTDTVCRIECGRSGLEVGKTATVVSDNVKRACFCCVGSDFCSALYRNDLHLVVSSNQTESVCASVSRILAYQFCIKLSPRVGSSRAYINIIRVASLFCPLNVSTFKPSVAACDGYGSFRWCCANKRHYQ